MEMDVQSYLIGHLGIVAGIFDTLNIAGVIDRVLPKRGSRNLLHSEATWQGHPAKDGRMDLKRFVLGMVTNQFGLPLFAKAYSGNKSDKKSIMEMIQKTQQAIDLDDKSYWIADSALYTEENIKLLGTETKWITHIPATVAEAQKLLNANLDLIMAICARTSSTHECADYAGYGKSRKETRTSEKR